MNPHEEIRLLGSVLLSAHMQLAYDVLHIVASEANPGGFDMDSTAVITRLAEVVADRMRKSVRQAHAAWDQIPLLRELESAVSAWATPPIDRGTTAEVIELFPRGDEPKT